MMVLQQLNFLKKKKGSTEIRTQVACVTAQEL